MFIWNSVLCCGSVWVCCLKRSRGINIGQDCASWAFNMIILSPALITEIMIIQAVDMHKYSLVMAAIAGWITFSIICCVCSGLGIAEYRRVQQNKQWTIRIDPAAGSY